MHKVLTECEEVQAPTGSLDFAMIFGKSPEGLATELRRVVPLLTPVGMVWACWPKKSSGVVTRLNDRGVRNMGLSAGLVDVKVCAVTETWSGLKFVRRVAERG